MYFKVKFPFNISQVSTFTVKLTKIKTLHQINEGVADFYSVMFLSLIVEKILKQEILL